LYYKLSSENDSQNPALDNIICISDFLISGEAAFYWSFLSGCISGSMAALSVNPFDVIKTRLQVLKKGQGELHYNGVSDAIM
jgi:Mitochondrial carrier protein.